MQRVYVEYGGPVGELVRINLPHANSIWVVASGDYSLNELRRLAKRINPKAKVSTMGPQVVQFDALLESLEHQDLRNNIEVLDAIAEFK